MCMHATRMITMDKIKTARKMLVKPKHKTASIFKIYNIVAAINNIDTT